MKYIERNWKKNVELGLYERGSANDIRKYDLLLPWISTECRIPVYTWIDYTDPDKKCDVESAYSQIVNDSIRFYPGDPNLIYDAIAEGKIIQRQSYGIRAYRMHRIHPIRDYFFLNVLYQ